MLSQETLERCGGQCLWVDFRKEQGEDWNRAGLRNGELPRKPSQASAVLTEPWRTLQALGVDMERVAMRGVLEALLPSLRCLGYHTCSPRAD